MLDDIRQILKLLSEKIELVTNSRVTFLTMRKSELDKEQEKPELFKDMKKAQKVLKEAKFVETELAKMTSATNELKDCFDFVDFLENEHDSSLFSELKEKTKKLGKLADELYLALLLKGEFDSSNAIITLHSGAGGVESQDWVGMLFRMYKMFANSNGFDVVEMDSLVGEEAGYKSITFLIKGQNSYGYLKAEKGVHRLVRISPFDSGARRHTSFASVEVMPEIEDDERITVKDDELKIDTFRAGGAGGQHVNKTESAVRITHIPTGIVVACQNERSQLHNRDSAMKMLFSKLAERREIENEQKAKGIQGELKKIEWGSQIRSYVFCPYQMVKDHRTSLETSNIDAVMDGEVMPFIEEYLKRM
ncbi:MAG: peptide chain release factor 2 [Firmicutes bacterium]|nr:peptide chain release factor 2 [Bacillota bacterium]MCL2256183.1 peptide chain release factor 2 [Bacillota bacterium]